MSIQSEIDKLEARLGKLELAKELRQKFNQMLSGYSLTIRDIYPELVSTYVVRPGDGVTYRHVYGKKVPNHIRVRIYDEFESNTQRELSEKYGIGFSTVGLIISQERNKKNRGY